MFLAGPPMARHASEHIFIILACGVCNNMFSHMWTLERTEDMGIDMLMAIPLSRVQC